MSKPLYEPVRQIKRIPRENVKSVEMYQREHELGLLNLLVAKHPDRAKEFLARLKESLPKAA